MDMLRNSLLELDEMWRRIYERASALARHNNVLLAEVFTQKQENEALSLQKSELETANKTAQKLSNALVLENRYLKRMLKQYLYPAIANEILKNENVLEQVDTEVTPTAMAEQVDHNIPSAFPKSVTADMTVISRETSLQKLILYLLTPSNQLLTAIGFYRLFKLRLVSINIQVEINILCGSLQSDIF